MIAGIDIGTSYSSISVLDKEGNPVVIRVSNIPGYGQENSIPSAVFVENDGKILVGQAAMQVRYKNLANFKDEFKRDLGTKDAYQLGALSLYPQDLYKELFIYLKKCAEAQCGEQITKAYITCPVAFSKTKRELVKTAATNAGLHNTELVEEPVAAAKSYCENVNLTDGCKLLIYDFGGGTFDVSLVQYINGNFEICGMPGGLENCGGSDINDLLKKDILSRIDPQTLEMINSNADYKQKFYGQISEVALKVKHILSAVPEVCELIPIGFDTLEYRITRDEFEKMIYSLIEETKECVLGTIGQASLSVKDIDFVIPVGGTSKIPLVHKMLKGLFGADKIKNDVDFEFAVCIGAVLFDKVPDEPAYIEECDKNDESDDWLYDVPNSLKLAEAGDKYYNGEGVEQNYAKAAELYRESAELGYVYAKHSLGYMYAHGLGVEQDYTEAVKWYKEAITNYSNITSVPPYSPSTHYNLGYMYEHGKGVSRDYQEARKYYRIAAEQGILQAQLNLGYMYHYGKGVRDNYDESRKWFGKAEDRGYPSDITKLRELYRTGKLEVGNKEEILEWLIEADEQGYDKPKAYIEIYRSGRFMGSLRAIIVEINGCKHYITNNHSHTRIVVDGNATHTIGLGYKNLLDDGDDITDDSKFSIYLSAEDKLVIDVTINREKILLNGKEIYHF